MAAPSLFSVQKGTKVAQLTKDPEAKGPGGGLCEMHAEGAAPRSI